MAVQTRSLIMDAPVNPAIMPGLMVIAHSTAISNAAVLTVSFPAKTVLTVLYNYTGTSVAVTRTIANNIATVTFTPTGDGTLDYLIVGSVTEVITSSALYAVGGGDPEIGGISSNEDDSPKG